MKRFTILLCCMVMAFNCWCQNMDSATIEISGLPGFLSVIIDEVPVTGEKISIVPGTHKVNILDTTTYYILAFGNIIIQQFRFHDISMNITVEKENLYIFNQALSNFCDAKNRTFFFNYPLPQLLNKKTSQAVSKIENFAVLNLDTDSCNVVHLNYNFVAIDNSKPAVFPFAFSTGYETLFLKGWTKDNFLIYYTIGRNSVYDRNKTGFVSKDCENLNFYLKPGYYWLGYNFDCTDYRGGVTRCSNSFIFKAEPGDSIKIDQRYYRPDKSVADFKVMHETNLNGIFFLPDGQYGWIVGDDKTILYTSDGGETWRYSQNGKSYDGFALDEKISYGRYKDVCFVDSLNGWIASESGLSHTMDGGVKWAYKDVESGATENLSNVRFFNKLVGFASQADVSLGAKLYSTTNGGESWKILDKYKTDAKFFYFSYNNIWKVRGSEISHSTDMGNTWTVSAAREEDFVHFLNSDGSLQSRNLETTRLENLIYFVDPMHGWILKDGIMATTDGGKTWEKQRISIVPDMVYFIHKDTGWAFTGNGQVCRTTDGGKNWSRLITNVLITNVRKVYFTDENNGWIVGEHGFIYQTSDGGQNWVVRNVLDFIP